MWESKRIHTFALTKPPHGTLAEWLGTGLQNRIQQFDSARYLQLLIIPPQSGINCLTAISDIPVYTKGQHLLSHHIGIILLAIILSANNVFALKASTLPYAPATNDTTVEFVNFYPGADVYQLEGHSALRITTPNEDIAVTWGMFDFDQPNFVYRFVKGETDYWVAAVNWRPFLRSYIDEGRRVVSHRLDLTSEQKRRLIDLIGNNLAPQNRVYRYNYVLDNCATRPLSIVEQAIGDSIILGSAPGALDSDVSFRDIMRFYHEAYPWYQFGIDLALGSGIDYHLNNREKSFAPVILDRQLTQATVNGRPLVSHTTVLNDTPPDNAILPPTPWYLHPITICWGILALIILVAIRDVRRMTITRWVYALMFTIYGATGLITAFLVFISEHYATSPNWLLVWLNPLALIVPITIWSKRLNHVLTWYMTINCILLLLLMLSWPLLSQSTNSAFWPLISGDIILSGVYAYIRHKTSINSTNLTPPNNRVSKK